MVSAAGILAMSAVRWCVVLTPALDQDVRFPEHVEDLPIEKFLPELAVEEFAAAGYHEWHRASRHRSPGRPAPP